VSEVTDNSASATSPQSWKDRSPAMKAGAAARGLVNLALMIWAVRDIRQRPDSEIKGNRKIWMMAAFAPPIGPVAYFLFGRKRDVSIGDDLL
jgi:hypothetical protein